MYKNTAPVRASCAQIGDIVKHKTNLAVGGHLPIVGDCDPTCSHRPLDVASNFALRGRLRLPNSLKLGLNTRRVRWNRLLNRRYFTQ